MPTLRRAIEIGISLVIREIGFERFYREKRFRVLHGKANSHLLL